MRDGSLDITRLRATDDLEGCTKLTAAPDPILKVSQCVVSLSLAWLTVRALPDVAMVPEPATTWPLVGSALPGSESAKALTPCRARTASMMAVGTG